MFVSNCRTPQPILNNEHNVGNIGMSNQRLLVEYLANRRPGEEIVFSEIRSVLEWSDETIITMMEDLGLGKRFRNLFMN